MKYHHVRLHVAIIGNGIPTKFSVLTGLMHLILLHITEPLSGFLGAPEGFKPNLLDLGLKHLLKPPL